MLLDRSIATENMLYVAVRLSFNILNGHLVCIFISLINLINYLINYLSIIKIIFDIVLRAVNAYKDKYPPPQLEQINTIIKHNRISLFDNVSSKDRNVTIAIVSQNASSAVHFVLQRISRLNLKLSLKLKLGLGLGLGFKSKMNCEVNYAK